MAKSSSAPFSLVECGDFDEGGLFVASYDHLGYAFAIVDDEGFGGHVDEYDAYLSSVVCIYGAWGVEHGDAFFQCEA